LILPQNGLVYVDTPVAVYTIERHPIYEPLLRPLWRAQTLGEVRIATSHLTLLEALVIPERDGNTELAQSYEALFNETMRLMPIDLPIIRAATTMCARFGLKTPDAIHAATALESGCTLFITNDPHFRRVPGLEVAVLHDLLSD
jgi:predicted nucleic acid-binding protein